MSETHPAPGSEPDEEDRCSQCGAPVEGSWLMCAWCGHALAVAAELAAGTALSHAHFVVRRVLGRGGFGITYAVDDQRLQRQVAIKELFPQSAVRHGLRVLAPPEARLDFRDARTRFLGEARVLARFSHPGIVRVFEVFEEHGTAYLVMELLEGRTLSTMLHARGAPFTEAETLDVAARVGGALRAVHAAGVLHRDLNPSNVVLTDTGRLVLIDFGIARAFEQGTQFFTRVVTPGYAPLEQYAGQGRFGPATDVYGLAATLYRLATATMPAPALDRQAGSALSAPHRLAASIGKDLSDALLDGLELDPSHRPQTIDAFLARLGIDPTRPVAHRSLVLDGFPVTGGPPHPPSPGPGVATDPPTLAPIRPRPSQQPPPPPPAQPSLSAPAAADFAGPGPDRSPSLRPVGPHRPGRRRVLLPLAVATVALASAAPLVLVAVLVLVALPAVATAGDLMVHRHRRWHDQPDGWFARSGDAVAVPVRFLANLVTSVVRAVPALAAGGVMVGAWALVHGVKAPVAADEVMLRLAGVIAAVVLLYPLGSGSRWFRTGLGFQAVTDSVTTEDGRLDHRGYVLWVMSVAVVAAALWLHPDPWPIHG